MAIDLSYDESHNLIANVSSINASLAVWTIPQSIFDPTSASTFDIVLPDQQVSIINDAISQALMFTYSNQLTQMLQKWTADK